MLERVGEEGNGLSINLRIRNENVSHIGALHPLSETGNRCTSQYRRTSRSAPAHFSEWTELAVLEPIDVQEPLLQVHRVPAERDKLHPYNK